jgi:hypothetical protein
VIQNINSADVEKPCSVLKQALIPLEINRKHKPSSGLKYLITEHLWSYKLSEHRFFCFQGGDTTIVPWVGKVTELMYIPCT